ncbi:hypothetical protein [Bacillus sp. EB600]|uniref:hypothetical protein n=1 Tax=Bacillus sp. EB600 TaxID=2806345 RepID=UPI00210C29AE|nr:hypothetical protein [Bacillus sp. EB600]MCQ6279430.1 hypothetical protein [Bacillus sp. EB600]
MNENTPEELVQIEQKAKENHEAKEKQGNPVVKAQKQISSQRTVGVYSPQQE